MEVRIGTCGWSFPDWKGTFYPPGTKDELAYYATKFDAVELDNTYYRIPSAKTVDAWRERTPEGFLFCPKMSGKITHERMLEGTDELVEVFMDAVGRLGEKLGPVLVMLHPKFGRDQLPKLEAFLSRLPEGFRYAVEFRHRSWSEQQEAVELLRSLKMCMAVTYHPWYVRLRETTADFVYMRLMGQPHGFPDEGHLHEAKDELLGEYAVFLKSLPPQVKRAFAFLSNHFEGHGPATAERLRALLRG
ncbi:MAG: DUF72 domain-containing protein [Armatimonadota bacterium]